MEVEIPNADNRLKPGMYARVVLSVEERTDAILVPKTAVVDFEGRRGVWTADADNKATFVPVQIGLEDADQVQLLGGVAAGDRVVTVGGASLRAGDTLVLPGQGPPGQGGGRGGRPGGGGPRPGAGAARGR